MDPQKPDIFRKCNTGEDCISGLSGGERDTVIEDCPFLAQRPCQRFWEMLPEIFGR